MRWMLHGSISPAAAEALRRHGQEARSLTDLGLAPETSAVDVFKAAIQQQLDVITTDSNLAGAPYSEHIAFPRCIVFLNVEQGEVEQDDAIDRLFERYKRLTPGRLYTVTASRVKIRQLPTVVGE
jgi:predicted nuclease of predicted toxin-antitoxin system